jgi:hypothetical protein
MPSGAAVTVYEGKCGRTFRVKYRDASGRQVMETLGREAEGWTERKARPRKARPSCASGSSAASGSATGAHRR